MEDFVLKFDTILIGLVAFGGIILKIIDEIKRARRIKKVDISNQDVMNQIIKNRINSLQALIYSDAPLLLRIESFLEYIKLGGNHSTTDWATANIILPNKALWWSVVERYKNEKPTDITIFNESMKMIREYLH